jgi:hypothetical protein
VVAAGLDDIRPLYRIILALGALAILILVVGVVEFVYFEPPGQRTTNTAHVKGVYAYDTKTKQTSGHDSHSFSSNQDFAAVVDWSSLPAGLVVAARWYDDFGDEVGGAGPAPAGQLVGREVVPVETPEGEQANLPGDYLFVVERFSHGQPVEVLARRIVLVRRVG